MRNVTVTVNADDDDDEELFFISPAKLIESD